jgi:ABC-type sugar transport system substrate-binding protein
MSALCSRLRAHAARLAVLALPLAAAPAAAQSQADADLKAISAYTLTMPKYQQYLDASVNVAKAAAKDPTLEARFEDFGNKSLSEQIKVMDGVPQIRSAIVATGLTTRDYALTQGALLQAGMAYAMAKGAGMPVDSVVKKAGVSRANIEFYQKNEAEIGRLAKEAEARSPKRPAEDDSGDDVGYDDAGDEAGEVAE